MTEKKKSKLDDIFDQLYREAFTLSLTQKNGNNGEEKEDEEGTGLEPSSISLFKSKPEGKGEGDSNDGETNQKGEGNMEEEKEDISSGEESSLMMGSGRKKYQHVKGANLSWLRHQGKTHTKEIDSGKSFMLIDSNGKHHFVSSDELSGHGFNYKNIKPRLTHKYQGLKNLKNNSTIYLMR